MAATVIDGKAIAEQMKGEIIAEVNAFKEQYGFVPGVAVVQVGSSPDATWYAKAIKRNFDGVGMAYNLHSLPEDVPAETLQATIMGLNQDPRVSGIIALMPLPAHLDKNRDVIAVMSPAKDVDGVHPENAGRIGYSDEGMIPCTPAAAIEIIERIGVDLKGMETALVGQGNVGMPLALLLLQRFATLSVVHVFSKNSPAHTSQADLLISAAGKAGLIKANWVKPGAIVIDVGINNVDGKLVGDVAPDVWEVASQVSPVPGGVGNVTNMMLLKNTLKAAKNLVTK